MTDSSQRLPGGQGGTKLLRSNRFLSLKRVAFGTYQRGLAFMMTRLPAECVVLMLHRIRNDFSREFDPQRAISISPDRLSLFLKRLTDRGISFISLDELADSIKRGTKLNRCAAVTLDDGFRDNFETGQQIFDATNVPYAVFAVSRYVNRTTLPARFVVEEIVAKNDSVVINDRRYSCGTVSQKYTAYRTITNQQFTDDGVESLAAAYDTNTQSIIDALFMNRDQLRSISESPLCTVGSHTVNHFRLRGLAAAQLAHEMKSSKQEIEDIIDQEVKYLAYPYGSCFAAGRREYLAARESGYACAFSTIAAGVSRASRKNLHALSRIHVSYEDATDLEQFVAYLMSLYGS